MEPLTDPEVKALVEVLDAGYKAVATYERVIADFGPIQPFVNIIEAERRDIEALRSLFDRYELAMPANPWAGVTPRFESKASACVAGVKGEIENAAMYEHLLSATQRRDIVEVFENLQRASQEKHLPAFRRCAQSGSDGQDYRRGENRRRRRRGNEP